MDAGFVVDADQLNAHNLREIFEVFHRQRLAERGVMRSTGIGPRCGRDRLQQALKS